MSDVTVDPAAFVTWQSVVEKADRTGTINPFVGANGVVYASDPASGLVVLGKWGGGFIGSGTPNVPAQELLPGLADLVHIQSPLDLTWLTDFINQLRDMLRLNPWLVVALGGALLLLLLERRDRR